MSQMSTSPAEDRPGLQQGLSAGTTQDRRPAAEAAWPDHRLTELLHIEHPIALAPMASLGTVELAAAVCRAGGLGSLGCAAMQPHSVM
jgi:hypothetical protein